MNPPNGLRTAFEWDQGAEELGFAFPEDYREFVETYGSGSICGELDIIVPNFKEGPYFNAPTPFSRFIQYTSLGIGRSLVQMRQGSPNDFPYPIFPQNGGLLAWAGNSNSDYCFWLTKGNDPDKWPVVVWHRGWPTDNAWQEFNCGMAEFLLILLCGQDDGLNDELAGAEGPQIWVSTPV